MNAASEHERYFRQLPEELQHRAQHTSYTTVVSAFFVIILVYQLILRLENPVFELLWNFAIYATPKRLIYAINARTKPTSMQQSVWTAEWSESQRHAQKSETVRRMLGLDGAGLLSRIQRTKSFPVPDPSLRSTSDDKPPGLGNWDNSCYQNSVIQGLVSLASFAAFLEGAPSGDPTSSTKAALKDIMEKLNRPSNFGAMFWTPAQLKSMSSWQQQDAQEYYSKLMDDVEKESMQTFTGASDHAGLAALQIPVLGRATSITSRVHGVNESQSSLSKETQALRQLPDELYSVVAKNPLEGLLAQRVGCLKCGFVEGLSLIPFNCLTLPLGKRSLYDIRSCLDEYTALEPINGVDCAKCTLLQSKGQLEKLRNQVLGDTGQGLQSSAPLVSEALIESIDERLKAVIEALDNQDVSDNTILRKCQISQKSKVSSTKTRQAVVARAPESLAIHVNRSVFNEMTGALSKNHADVRFPLRFSLAPWCLGGRSTAVDKSEHDDRWNMNPRESMLSEHILDEAESGSSPVYELRAALTHYGRHENGHYICYRRHVVNTEASSEISKGLLSSWWRFSDEDVTAVSEDDVLAQGDVFMLFYETVGASSSKSGSCTLPVEQQDSDHLIITQDMKTNSNTLWDIDCDGSSTAQVAAKVTEAEDVKTVHNTVRSPDALSEDAANLGTTNAHTGAENSTSEQPAERDCAEATDERSRIFTTQPDINIEIDQTSTSPPYSSGKELEEPIPTSSPHAHPPLLSPTPTSQIDKRNVSSTMRTATPRSGRSNISRGQKGMGQVSSMVSSH
ncbi:MAG: hypothetical protein Q9215_004690 [Flavoplaca cf. flavocitrina]